MVENAKYVLTFVTDSNVRDKYEIPRANAALTEEQIARGMDDIVYNGNFATVNGEPMQSESAELVTTTVEELYKA